jgi:hypothetical protein
MISILICGYNETYERKIKSNIFQTIGCEHEILYYKNSNQKGICEVYNLLTQQASGEILCFIHEDTEILTPDWGSQIKEGLLKKGSNVLISLELLVQNTKAEHLLPWVSISIIVGTFYKHLNTRLMLKK